MLRTSKSFSTSTKPGRAETVDGVPYNNTYCQVIHIRDGQMARVTEYMDTALIDSVFGVDPGQAPVFRTGWDSLDSSS